jgi:CRP-like cAMP-binding protein
VLIREGQPVDSVFIVIKGQLTISAGRPGRILTVVGAGEIVGELSFVDSRPPSATVSAHEPATVLRIPRAVLSAKLESDVAFAGRFYRAVALLLAQRLRSTTIKLGYGGSQSLEEDQEAADEIDPALLDTVGLAAARFDWMLERLERQ